jgi:methionyl-tRNA formyltransferase
MTARKLIFMGTPDFAAVALKALVDAGHEILAVYSQPPRPAGRGHDLRKSPVHGLAEAQGIPVRTPASLKTPEAQAEFAAFKPEIAVVAAYGLILPQAILDAPVRGCLNIHASLLPRWRGAAPIQRAILAGDAETGISIMQMDAGLDTGAVVLEERIAIAPRETAGQLHDRLAALGGKAIVAALDGDFAAHPQPGEGVTYAAKISPEEARLDFAKPASELARAVRAFNPVPGAWCLLPNGERLKILEAEVVAQESEPGVVFQDRLTIGTANGALRPTLVQRQGKRAMTVEEFLRGNPPVNIGDRLS